MLYTVLIRRVLVNFFKNIGGNFAVLSLLLEKGSRKQQVISFVLLDLR